MSTDRRADILAAIEARETAARAATQGPWWAKGQRVVYGEDGEHYDGLIANTLGGFAFPAQNAHHIAMWHPEVVLRWCAAARRVLDRHRPDEVPKNRPSEWCCVGCSDEDREQPQYVDWPCIEVSDLADMLGIELTDASEGR
jgi:hypothetical protein